MSRRSPDLRFFSALFAGLLAIAADLSGCSSSSPGPADGGRPLCIVGESSACACTDGRSGAQVCQTDGTFGSCSCTAGADAGPDAGVDAGLDAGPDGGLPPDGGNGGGPVGSACTRNADCQSLACLPGGAALAGDAGSRYLCSGPCVQTGDCPNGWTCAPVLEAATNLCLPPGVDAGPIGGGLFGAFVGAVTLIGGVDPAGTLATLSSPNFSGSGQADGDGGFSVLQVPAGTFTLSLSRTITLAPDSGYFIDGGLATFTYQAVVPELLYLPGSTGFVDVTSQFGSGFLPLTAVELPLGVRLSDSSTADDVVDPDGGAFFYFNDAGLAELSVATGTTTAVASGASLPVFSPDDRWIYFLVADGGLTSALFTAPLSGSPVTAIASGVFDLTQANLSFSPDGTQLFYVSYASTAGSLNQIPVAGGSAIDLGILSAPSQGVSPILFSPDGTQMLYELYAPGSPILALKPVSGSSATHLGTGVPPVSPAYMLFSPDSKSLAFIDRYSGANQAGRLELMTLPAGTPAEIAPAVSDLTPANFVFSPDSSRFAYVGQTDGGPQLFLASTSGGSPVQLGVAGATQLGFAPKGRFFAYIDSLNQLWTVAGPGAPPTLVVGPTPSTFVFSPDGTRLLCSDSQTLTEVTLSTGTSAAISDTYQFLSLVFTGDGQHALFTSDQIFDGTVTVNELTLSTGVSSTLVPSVYGFPSIAPGGQFAYLIDAPGSLWRIDLAGVTASQIAATGVNFFQFSPEGTEVVYGGVTLLSSVPLAGGAPVLLASNLAFGQPVFFEGGRRVAFLAAGVLGPTLETVPVTGGPAVQLATKVTSYDLSPDGRYFGFSEPSTFWPSYVQNYAVVPVGGGAAVAINSFSNSLFVGGAVVSRRSGTPAPFGFQDGLYFTRLP